jgi:nucleoside-diphosphate-sugar epimerase
LEVTKNIDIILNFAAMDGGRLFKKTHSAEIFKTNTKIVLNILEAAKANNVDRTLIISSIEVYSDKTKSPIKEEYGFEGELDGNKFGYVKSKRIGEITAKLFSQNGSKIAIARLGNIYGPTDTIDKKRGRVIPTFIDKALKQEDIVISGNGLQKIAFLYITDLVDSLLDLVEKYPVGEPVNLVGGERISLKELASLIISLTKSKSKIVISSKGDNNDRIISIEKARKVIGFSPKVDIKNGIETILKHYSG